jgi:hypothetical protein
VRSAATDVRAASLPTDPHLTAASQLRALSTSRPHDGNPLDLVPTSLLPMGASTWDATAHYLFITKDLGTATVTRNATEIDVNNATVNAVVKQDAKNPNLVDVSVHMGGSNPSDQSYQGTLSAIPGGFKATTTDGKTLTAQLDGNQVVVTPSGWSQVPQGATVTLSPQ